MKFFTLDLSRKVDRLIFIIILMGAGVFIIVVTIIGYEKTSGPEFCAGCHVMLPEYYTWQNSSHSKIKCVDCHFEPGIENFLKQKWVLRQAYAFITKDYILPIRMPIPLRDTICLSCHSTTREVSLDSDVIVPHEVHRKKGITCVQCHQGVAHGNIPKTKATMLGDLRSWSSQKGMQQMSIENTSPPMGECMSCHSLRQAPLDCDACHGQSKKPSSHQRPNFNFNHGGDAQKSLSDCNLCHGYTGFTNGEMENALKEKGTLVSTNLAIPKNEVSRNDVVRYSRDNKFCINCHSKKPPTHIDLFKATHGIKAEKNKESCFVCHSNRQEEVNPVTSTACATCHPSGHATRDWRRTHPIPVERFDQSCLECHSSSCTDCHYSG